MKVNSEKKNNNSQVEIIGPENVPSDQDAQNSLDTWV